MATIAVIGNPNAGKTTLFNALTGLRQKVANYAGVTVDVVAGQYRDQNQEFTLVDLPGTYTLTSTSPEEKVTRDFLTQQKPDAVLCVVDATHLERHLYLVLQVLELGIPVVVALNKWDCLQHTQINVLGLAQTLGVTVVPTVAHHKTGLVAVMAAVTQALKNPVPAHAWLEPWKNLQSQQVEQLASKRYQWIHQLVSPHIRHVLIQGDNLTDRVDHVLTHRLFGIPIFLFLMWLVFQITFWLGQFPMAWIDNSFKFLAGAIHHVFGNSLLTAFLADGVIGGVGAVLVFLPNILIMFFALSLLEGTGYMARAAFLVDSFMQKIGLSGKSFIPMVVGFGCNVPAFMATRTIEDRNDRLVTLLTIPLMSCSARLSVYVLLIGTFFPPAWAGHMLFAIYLLGILLAVVMAKLLRSSLFKSPPTPFIMELPQYHWPTLQTMFNQVTHRAHSYIKNAGTYILIAAIVIWFGSNFPQFPNGDAASRLEHSYMGQMGKWIEPAIAPLGFDWKIGVSLVAGFAAKEVVVSTMSTIYHVGNVAVDSTQALQKVLRADPVYKPATVMALLVFILVYLPCISATSVFHVEAGAWRYTLLLIAYTTALAWLLSFGTYRLVGLFF